MRKRKRVGPRARANLYPWSQVKGVREKEKEKMKKKN